MLPAASYDASGPFIRSCQSLACWAWAWACRKPERPVSRGASAAATCIWPGSKNSTPLPGHREFGVRCTLLDRGPGLPEEAQVGLGCCHSGQANVSDVEARRLERLGTAESLVTVAGKARSGWQAPPQEDHWNAPTYSALLRGSRAFLRPAHLGRGGAEITAALVYGGVDDVHERVFPRQSRAQQTGAAVQCSACRCHGALLR